MSKTAGAGAESREVIVPLSMMSSRASFAGSRLVLETGQRWILVHTRPKEESQAEFHLKLQNFRTYLPFVLKTVRHARRLRTIRAALFPRYLFIALDLERDRWLSVQSTVGVSSIFSCDGRPVPVAADIVESLMLR